MGNYCSELCSEPEIQVLRVSDFKNTPQKSPPAEIHEQDQAAFIPSAQKGYFTENLETVKHQNPTQRRERRAPYRFATGGVYEGEWVGNMRDGQGVMMWAGTC